MRFVHTRSLAAALLAAAVSAACAGAQTAPAPAPQPAALPAIDAAVHPWTPADAQFMTMMIGHHGQAIEMSRLAPTNGASAAVLRLAERIINAQEDEIATMRQWLADRKQPVPDAQGGHDAHAGHHGAGHGALMAGMLTEAQMAELRAARGAEFDRLFLTYMIQHHRGAVSMVTELFGSYGAGQDETVFKFASDVNVDQATEIARMQRMLADLLLEPRSP